MEFFIDVPRFLDETSLDKKIVCRIRERHDELKKIRGVYSVNDTLGKEIAAAVWGDLVSAHFRRWINANYVLGDCE